MSLREARRDARDARGLLNEGVAFVSDLLGADDRVRGNHGRAQTYGYTNAYRGAVARDRFQNFQNQSGDDDGRDDDRRGDFIRDPRRAGLGSGQPRGDARGGQGQSQDPRIEATEEYVFALADAAQSPAGSPERAAAMKKAKDILTDPENGLMPNGPDGGVRFPQGMKVILQSDGKSDSYIHFDGIASRAPSADESIRRGINAVAGLRIGYPITDADLAALRGNTATVPVGTGTEQTKPTAPDAQPAPAPAPGTATPAAATFVLPPASGGAAVIYTTNKAGGKMNAEDAPKIAKSQVGEIQRKLGVKDDEKWGPATQEAFAKKLQAMNPPINPRDVDFTNPNDPETVSVMAQFNPPAAGAGVTPPKAPGAVGAPGAPGTPDATVTSTTVPDTTRMTAAVRILNELAGDDKALSASEIATYTKKPELVKRIEHAFDLNNNDRVEDTERTQIVAAAGAQTQAVTVEGGAAALSAMFAGATLAATETSTTVDVNPAAKMTAAVSAFKALDANKDGIIQKEEVPQSDPVDAKGNKISSGPEYMAYNERSAQLAAAVNLSGGAEVSSDDMVAVITAAEKQGLKFEKGAKEAANELFANITFAPGAQTSVADAAPARDGQAASVSRVPPPVSSELAGLDQNSFDGPNAGLPNLNIGGPRQVF